MIRLDSIGKRHGKQILFVEASCAINRGEKIGLVGPNGSGKTTIFRMITREEQPDEGQISVDRGVTVGYFSQDVGEMTGKSIVAETMDGVGPVSKIAAELAELELALADPERADEMENLLEKYGQAQAQWTELDGYSLDAKAREILAGLGFSNELMDADVGTLSGGWKMRVALAKILLLRPDALLLDEPTNHLDIESIIWLEGFLQSYEGSIVITSHDRAFMNRLCTKILEIDGGDITTYTGNYDFYEKQRAIAGQQAEAQYERQQAMLAKEMRFIERFKTHAAKAAQVQSRVKKLDKIEKMEPPKKSKRPPMFDFRVPARSGEDVAKLEGVVKRFGNRTIYDGLNFLVRRRERWCVMGVNGAGKSTLLKIVAGTLEPDAGGAVVGASVKLGYFAQHAMDLLDPDATVMSTLTTAFPEASIGTMRTLAGCFGFSGDDIDKPCRVLSGGEKARLVLARMLYDPPNFLVLDEPTNHLDITTKEMLVEALSNFEGTMLFVSHDRHFLAALSNRVLELTPEGVHQYGGGYVEYVAASGHEAPGLRR
ncbi:MAG: ABC-F family ATP-binding cassette domain-containing protein [Polyangiaceae bacterium]|nr:ABC-F family ATP-binding cassette domain-containing protein [Polyangiaceae bacterium]